MEKITRTKNVEVSTVVKSTQEVEETVYKTTDGRVFIQSDYNDSNRDMYTNAEVQAKKHQDAVDEYNTYVESLNYQDVSHIKTYKGVESGYGGDDHERSFLFDWNSDYNEEKYRLNKIVDLDIPNEMPSGRYIVIQYCSYKNYNGRTEYDYHGYFGLLEDYIKEMESVLDDVKKLK